MFVLSHFEFPIYNFSETNGFLYFNDKNLKKLNKFLNL